MVHLGITSTGSEISLESVAHKNGYKKTDIYGKLPENGSAIGKHDVLHAALNVHSVAEKLNNSAEFDVPIQVSSNAGRYLCEFIFYTSLNIDTLRVVFVHVPNIDKGYTTLEMALVVKEMILLLLEQISGLM